MSLSLNKRDIDEEEKLPFIEAGENNSLLADEDKPAKQYRLYQIATAVLFLTTVFLLWVVATRSDTRSGFETGFLTDLGKMKPYLRVQKIKFTGGPTFDENGKESLRFPDDEPRYIGEPTDEMDNAWKLLEENRYFLLTEVEARQAWGVDYMQFWNEFAGGFLATFDVFHLIHCLDHIRQSFYPERYPHQGIHGILHRDHCIDSLRQTLMCQADITPIPTRWYPGVEPDGLHYIDSDVEHTCRDFWSIREYTNMRVNGSSKTVRQEWRGLPGAGGLQGGA